ncbi:MAG: Gfo/Idh/MocA family oxidoreductase [Opitutaceae bacterium]|nr:Gfo/Idh/MocA family oxidoreductase [Opitutaceae bacterium]
MTAKRSEGFSYAPASSGSPVVRPGEFVYAAAHLDHGHIYGQCAGLTGAGATLKWVYDPDAEKVRAFQQQFAGVRAARSLDEILDDNEVRLVASAAVPCERGPVGCRVMRAGKDYFSDKSPFTTPGQLDEARKTAAATRRKYMVYYSERLHVESAWHVDALLQAGAIGKIVHISITGPHRLSAKNRPAWFFDKKCYGGILTDIASHQVDQFLHYARADGGVVRHARVANFAHPEHPGLEDFGEAVFELSNGVSCHSRVDWFTPDGLRTWGDGRTVIVGTAGYLEIRKYVDVGQETPADCIYLVDGGCEQKIECKGRVGFPFFGRFIQDCLNRTEQAMTQGHAFMAAELSMQAQQIADRAGRRHFGCRLE